jgi:hypothetical protein
MNALEPECAMVPSGQKRRLTFEIEITHFQEWGPASAPQRLERESINVGRCDKRRR